MVRVEDYRGFSHFTMARSKNGIDGWEIDSQPTFAADPVNYPEEIYGIEDARITYIDEMGKWAVGYTAFWILVLYHLLPSRRFRNFDRVGAILPPENKDAAVFPMRIDGKWAMLHRPVSGMMGSKANIWISFSPDMKYWGEHEVLLYAREGGWWDANKIGLSPQPIRTYHGWFIFLRGVRQTTSKASYRLGLALLDLENPPESASQIAIRNLSSTGSFVLAVSIPTSARARKRPFSRQGERHQAASRGHL